MQSTQNLTNELVSEYIQSKYDKKYLTGKIKEILEAILPEIATIIKNRKEREATKLWDNIKETEEIKNLFRKILDKTDRPILIYVASKFQNNQYFGTKIIGEALIWK